jgi:hypothetical protein
VENNQSTGWTLSLDMETILKDLAKLESKSVDTTTTVDEIQASIDALERWRAVLASEGVDGGA